MGVDNINSAIDTAYNTLSAAITGNTVHDNSNKAQPETRNIIWVRFSIVYGEARKATIGIPGKQRNIGTVMATVYGPLEKGDKDVNLIAEQIAAKFRWRTVGGFIRFKTPTVSGGRRDKEVNQWRVDVSCPFLADEIITPEAST